ncbi:MAG: hypothetical protein IKR19_07940 [Acholeplasmatales bacterium]|nr:hypothetical protein [Acholeplasmatales bacterium]
MNFENKKYKVTVNGDEFEVHATRIIASWLNATNGACFGLTFKDWLGSLGLSYGDAKEIEQLAINGKLELEASASKFMEN